MGCTWKEEQAYRFADGSLEPEAAGPFESIWSECDRCHERVEEAERMERLLVAASFRLRRPAALASRIAAPSRPRGGASAFPGRGCPEGGAKCRPETSPPPSRRSLRCWPSG